MTDPIPADLDELEQIYTEYTRPWNGTQLQEDRNFSMREALDKHTPALLAAARERDALRTELAEARAALVAFEWARTDDPESPSAYCPTCFGTEEDGHKPGCILAPALGQQPTMPTGPEKS